MEAPTAAVAAAFRAGEAARPSWVRVTLVTLFALATGALLIALAAWPLSELGLLPSDAIWAGTDRMWPAEGSWALLANLGWVAAVCCALAWWVSRSLWAWTEGWNVRVWPVALAIATGWSSDTGEIVLAGFVLVVVVARNVALTPSSAPARPRRPLLAVAAAALALATLSYQPMHPLAVAFDGRDSNTSLSVGYDSASSSGRSSASALAFAIGNEGLAPLTVRSVRARHLSDHRVAIRVGGAAPTHLRLARGDEALGIVRLTPAACEHSPSSYLLETLVVRYETLGFTRVERLPVDPPATLRC